MHKAKIAYVYAHVRAMEDALANPRSQVLGRGLWGVDSQSLLRRRVIM